MYGLQRGECPWPHPERIFFMFIENDRMFSHREKEGKAFGSKDGISGTLNQGISLVKLSTEWL